MPLQIHTTSKTGRAGWGSATIRPIGVIRGELHALSLSLAPHPLQGCQLSEATRMTRRKRIIADRLISWFTSTVTSRRIVAGPHQVTTTKWGCWGKSANIRPIRVIRGKLHALSPSLTPHPLQGCQLGEATRMTRRKRIIADGLISWFTTGAASTWCRGVHGLQLRVGVVHIVPCAFSPPVDSRTRPTFDRT